VGGVQAAVSRVESSVESWEEEPASLRPACAVRVSVT